LLLIIASSDILIAQAIYMIQLGSWWRITTDFHEFKEWWDRRWSRWIKINLIL